MRAGLGFNPKRKTRPIPSELSKSSVSFGEEDPVTNDKYNVAFVDR